MILFGNIDECFNKCNMSLIFSLMILGHCLIYLFVRVFFFELLQSDVVCVHTTMGFMGDKPSPSWLEPSSLTSRTSFSFSSESSHYSNTKSLATCVSVCAWLKNPKKKSFASTPSIESPTNGGFANVLSPIKGSILSKEGHNISTLFLMELIPIF